jgi:hypothetical protein
MKNNTEKLEETKIEISLRTGIMHRNSAEEAETKICYTSYYLSAINYFIRIALEAESLLEQQTETTAFRNDMQFRENLQYLTQIAGALAEWLPDHASDLHRSSKEMSAMADTPEDSTETDDLAKQISEVLKNPNLPVELYNAILHGADDIINISTPNVSERFETSPEHIKAVLKMRSNE